MRDFSRPPIALITLATLAEVSALTARLTEQGVSFSPCSRTVNGNTLPALVVSGDRRADVLKLVQTDVWFLNGLDEIEVVNQHGEVSVRGEWFKVPEAKAVTHGDYFAWGDKFYIIKWSESTRKAA